ncbi:hypothetical protein [Pyrobaculum calidifontis]|uniref:hypothetical protein n=1 Tax=Pyrobaculum calidifontis TaxID=181486 RepID=UPI00186B7014|nr:hypothetical protein [Pyrobaculum calidifontis]
MKAFLVTKNPSTPLPEGIKVVYIPFVEEDVLYIFDERFGFLEITGKEKIGEFIAQRSAQRSSQ